MSSFNSKAGGSTSSSSAGEENEKTLAEVKANEHKNTRQYESGLERAKQVCIQDWKEFEEGSMTEAEFEEQLRSAVERGLSNKEDHAFVNRFMLKYFKGLNDAKLKKHNRLAAVRSKLDAEFNIKDDDDVATKARELMPTYERVISSEDEVNNANILKMNKLLEFFVFQVNTRLDMLEYKLAKELTQRIDSYKETQLTFNSQDNTNGVLYYIGSRGRTTTWTNPHTAGFVTIIASSISFGRVDDIAGRENSDFFTDDLADSYIILDLGEGRKLVPNHYSFGGSWSMSNWRLEGSNDGIIWTILKTHVDEARVPRSWPITGATEGYRYFRLIRTRSDSDSDSDYHQNLVISCLELYGKYLLQLNPIPVSSLKEF